MRTTDFVAMQMSKRFTARKIPDLRHIQHCRKLTCFTLIRGHESLHSPAMFEPDWLYEGFTRFRDRPNSYYANEVIPWETLLEYM